MTHSASLQEVVPAYLGVKSTMVPLFSTSPERQLSFVLK